MRVWTLLLILSLICLEVAAFDFFGLFGDNGGSKKKAKVKNEEPVDDKNAQEYLYKFGYAGPSQIQESSFGQKVASVGNTFKSAIKKFQEFAGITQTGELDIKTRKKMAEPRCGMLDVQPLQVTREDAYKWKKNPLTYSIFTYSTDIPHDQVTRAIRKAFDNWSEVSPLDFTETSNHNENADIKIKFASRNHGDPWPFDGKGGVLAHATMPTSGMLHFDEDENWVFMDAEKIANYGYTDVYPVAIHEIGHVLGLEHSRTKNSIMAPFYQETVDDNGNYVMPKLSSYDIQSIQDLYGPRTGRFRSTDTSSGGSWGGSRLNTTPRPRTTTESSGDGLFGSLWAKWTGRGGNSDRDRNRTPKEWTDWDSGRSSGSSSNSGSSNGGSGSSFGGFGSFLGGSKGDDGATTTLGRTDDGFGSSSGRSRGGSSFGGSSGSSFGGSSFGDSGSSFGGSGGSGSFGCPGMVDAVSPNPGGTVYLFSGSKVFEIRDKTIIKEHSLRTLFPNGPIYVEAAYLNKNDRTMVLFQSYKVYVFTYFAGRFSLDLSYPKSLPRTLTFNPTGAITWSDGHQFIFSRSDDFATYDEYWNEVLKEDKVSRYFSGLPKGIRGGLPSSGGRMSVFTRDKVMEYDTSRKMAVGTGQSLSSYLRC
ncbi:unnamed protein product [Bursaphelenchus okinawaensis]|uniref:Peptidase metallopeptidase domain-containing protein n=1 Tax=Bursaphelenchus okinawaensis TaxID=465554 RepID=A0A811L5A9_9BILA|nr:unnamed protein product [Bursaphelenchus okinawaensis]CAG9116979.1 unnamed protein product [Bursaphelenchus okinawaensis]